MTDKDYVDNKKELRQCTIADVGKRKYWYRTDIYGCVLCGKEKIDRQRVYDEDKKGTHWHDDACSGHF